MRNTETKMNNNVTVFPLDGQPDGNSSFLETVSLTASKGQKIMSDSIATICFIVVKCAMYEVFSSFGVVTNVLCLIVFFKLGFKETVNVSLVGLTIADLAGLVILLWMGVCYNPLFVHSDVHFDTLSVVYLSGGWPKLYLTRITSWLTAFVSLERCLCIAIPLKVKTILTPRRAAYVIIATCVVVGMTAPAVYHSTRLGWLWYPARNKTVLGLTFTEDRDEIYFITVAINFVFTNGSFLIVIACSLILVVSLNSKRRWRRNTIASAKKKKSLSLKEQRVSKMIIFISVIFLVCYFPGTVLFVVMLIVPEFGKDKLYHNLFTAVWGFAHILEALNSSVNIFVYVRMSSKFRKIVRENFKLLGKCTEKDIKSAD